MGSDIYRQPQWHWLIYGNGLQAQVVGGLDKVLHDHNGEEVLEFEIVPTDDLIISYGIQESDYTNAHTVVKRYYKVYHKVLNMNPAFVIHGLLCDYEGKDAAYVDYFFDLIMANRTLKKRIVDMSAQMAYLHDRLQQVESQTGIHDEQTLKRFGAIKKFVRGPVLASNQGGEYFEMPTEEQESGEQ